MGRPPKYHPKIGIKYNKWLCIDGPTIINKRTHYKYRCECGFIKWDIKDIVSGRSKQCLECAKGGNLKDKQFGKWKVISFSGINAKGERIWLCQCSCNYKTEQIIATATLLYGGSTACKRCNKGLQKGSDALKEKARKEADRRREELRGEVPDQWFHLPRTKSEAIEKGEDYYFYGECLNGHVELHTTSGGCPICSQENGKKWRQENKLRDNENHKLKRRRYSNDPFWRMVGSLRTRTAAIFNSINEIKNESTLQLLGCTRDELKLWIESQFYDHPKTGIKMSWDNYGKVTLEDNTWNCDHKIPLAYAGKDVKKLKELIHYKNLQPLWSLENIKKGAKFQGKRYGKKSETKK
tara:strand:- start:116 stop:1171 length:1056 start_codon:yes stop_codon:yes gene_type:complete